jgi:hypothetical protein
MNKRAQDLMMSPGTVAPKTVLTTVDQIRTTLWRNIGGGNYGVYCLHGEDNEKRRVFGVRSKKGKTQVDIGSRWVEPTEVFVEG